VGRFEEALGELDARKMDVALLPLPEVPARFVSRILYDEDFVLVARQGHPLAKKCTLETYAAAAHLMVSVSGDPQGAVDKVLAKRKLSRHVVLTVPSFTMAIAMVEESDLVVALPRHFVAKHAPRYKIVSFEPPMPLMSSPIMAVAPQVATRDGGLLWLLDSLEIAGKAARDLLRRR
jgi:DNA-binding transcriptional LysR family regulator